MVFGMFLLSCFLVDKDIKIEERIKVSYVSLDVIAFNKKSGPVTDLKPEDFIVKENGETVKITHFEILDFRDANPNSTLAVDIESLEQSLARPMQQVIFVLDLESTLGTQPFAAFEQVEQTLRAMAEKGGFKVAVYSMERGMVTDGFVTNMNHAIESLNDLKNRRFEGDPREEGGLLTGGTPSRFKLNGGPVGSVSQLKTGAPDLSELEQGFRDCLGHINLPEKVQCINSTYLDFMDNQSIRSERLIGELESLTYAFENNNDLKIMMFVSPGFGLGYLESAQKLARIYKQKAQGSNAIERNSLEDMASPQSHLRIDGDFNRVMHACIKNRVIFNTFDLFHGAYSVKRRSSVETSGISSQALIDAFSDYQRDMDHGLIELAEKSGGRFHLAASLKDTALETLDQNRFFYVLGYNSPPGKSGKYRNIKIKVQRKKTELLYRTGYFGG